MGEANITSQGNQLIVVPLDKIVRTTVEVTTLIKTGNFEKAHTAMEDLWDAHPMLYRNPALRRLEGVHQSALVEYIGQIYLERIVKNSYADEEGRFHVSPHKAREVEDAVDWMEYFKPFLIDTNQKRFVEIVARSITYEGRKEV